MICDVKNKILLIEDDATLSMIVAETLQRNGFNVINAPDGEAGLRKYVSEGADLIIADVMMPRMDGFTLGRRIRQLDKDVPLLFLTAKSEITDIVEGFELGCNDYLKKPFKMLELIVRIKALLRLIRQPNEDALKIGNYIFKRSTQALEFPGKSSAELSLIEARLLEKLISNVGNTVEASVLMILIWQRDDPYSRNSLHGFIHKLRHYLRYDPSISIINQRGIGYMLTLSTPSKP